MNSITIKELQTKILSIDNTPNATDKYFQKLIEEVGEVSRAMRKNSRLKDTNNIKGTLEEELYDVLYYTICLANMYNIDLENCAILKEKINSQKYNRPSIFD
jgi:NTP pyrophosphatase (non-canonical NTP hydrolase)